LIDVVPLINYTGVK